MKTLGLSMIVKNESHVILRVLNSVHRVIDYWVIVDTGSTDGTQDLITKFFEEKNIPGQLLQIEWKDDFSYARNFSLEEIEKHTDYGLWIDADEEMVVDPMFDKELLLSQAYDTISLKTVYGKVDYTRKSIWKTGIGAKWSGPIHELLASPNEKTGTIAKNVHVIVRAEGSSWKNIREKYLGHAKILEKYAYEVTDPRWVFYTAQSYRDAQEYEKAIEWYKKRAEMKTGFLEEIFISKFMVAKISDSIGKPKNECTILYQDAHASDNLRGESIKGLVQMYHRLKDWENAYVFSLYGLRYNQNNPYPNRVLFLDKGLYDYEMLELHALSCFYSNRIPEGSKYYWMMREQLEMLGANYLPEIAMKRIKDNEQYYPITYVAPKVPLQKYRPGFRQQPKKSKKR